MRFRAQLLPLAALLTAAVFPSPASAQSTTAAGDPLVERALANEVAALSDASHPMRYRLRKVSPRLTTVKEIIETREGGVARLLSRDDAPLSTVDAAKEEQRLNDLLEDASRQTQRLQREASDLDKFTKILHALPHALLYHYSRTEGEQTIYSFVPNPKFDPQNFEEELLTGMEGELWIDTKAARVTRLSGRLVKEVDYGWGLLGQIDKGATLLIEQQQIQPGIWRANHLVIHANYRVVYKSKSSDSTLELTGFQPVPQGLDYRAAIELLRQ